MTTATAFGAADLAFDAALHRYTLPDGTEVPSVTQILSATGVSVDFDSLAGMSERLGDAINEKRELGRALHADAHAFDDGDLVLRTVDPRVFPYLQAWVTFRSNTGLQPTTRERRVYHPTYGYAGTLDGIFRLDGPRHKHVLIDIATGDPEDAGKRYQTAAYQAAYAIDHRDKPIDARWAVRLCPEHEVPYRITEYPSGPLDQMRDFRVFAACLTVYQHQAARRRR